MYTPVNHSFTIRNKGFGWVRARMTQNTIKTKFQILSNDLPIDLSNWRIVPLFLIREEQVVRTRT